MPSRHVNASTIYCQCPACGQDSLAAAVQGAHRCSVCNFDYTTLASDPSRRERWMLENLRRGPMFQLAVLHLYRHVMQLAPGQANAEVVAFAERNGIKMPTGKPLSPFVILGVVILALVVCAIVALVLIRR